MIQKMRKTNGASNVPRLELDDQKDLLLYAMKIVPGNYKSLLSDHYQSSNEKKNNHKSKIGLAKRRGRKTRKKKKKSKRKKKKYKKSSRSKKGSNHNKSNKGHSSNSFLPIVVLNSAAKTDKDISVSKTERKTRKKYLRRPQRPHPRPYERDYYDDYFYDYPPPYSPLWYRHRRTIPRFHQRQGYNMKSSTSEDHYNLLDLRSKENSQESNRYFSIKTFYFFHIQNYLNNDIFSPHFQYS